MPHTVHNALWVCIVYNKCWKNGGFKRPPADFCLRINQRWNTWSWIVSQFIQWMNTCCPSKSSEHYGVHYSWSPSKGPLWYPDCNHYKMKYILPTTLTAIRDSLQKVTIMFFLQETRTLSQKETELQSKLTYHNSVIVGHCVSFCPSQGTWVQCTNMNWTAELKQRL